MPLFDQMNGAVLNGGTYTDLSGHGSTQSMNHHYYTSPNPVSSLWKTLARPEYSYDHYSKRPPVRRWRRMAIARCVTIVRRSPFDVENAADFDDIIIRVPIFPPYTKKLHLQTGIHAIATEFALDYPQIRPYINAALEKDPFVMERSFETQAKKLIEEPFQKLMDWNSFARRSASSYRNEIPAKPRRVVLDGLFDSLGEEDMVQAIDCIAALNGAFSKLPFPLQLVIIAEDENVYRRLVTDPALSMFIDSSSEPGFNRPPREDDDTDSEDEDRMDVCQDF